MTIKIGDKVPAVTLRYLGPDGMKAVQSEEFFADKKVVLFAVPGAFTRTCSQRHLPSYVTNIDKLKAKGVDTIACLAVNDPFVMSAWGKDQNVGDSVVMLADGNGELAAALGLTMDGSGFGLGSRAQRFAAIIDDGVVSWLAVEPGPGLSVSSVEEVLAAL